MDQEGLGSDVGLVMGQVSEVRDTFGFDSGSTVVPFMRWETEGEQGWRERQGVCPAVLV